MKLRIRGDTLRLRLAQAEVNALRSEGRVEDAIHFGPDAALRYAVLADADADRLTAAWRGGEVVVRIPAAQARAWADGDAVGMSTDQDIGDGRVLSVLVEKDFKCLVPRDGTDDDGFPNPAASC